MSLTVKQRLFVKEYLVDFNATQAAIRAGLDWQQSTGFYVYFLIDSEQIFYVGKGKGGRVSAHRRERFRTETANQVKAARLRAAIEGDVYAERVFAADLSEPDAMRLEKGIIQALRGYGLTNIASGSVHPLESQIARIDANLAAFRPFEEWDKWSAAHVRNFAVKHHGSMRRCYDWMIERFEELRDDYVLKLNSIKGNHHV